MINIDQSHSRHPVGYPYLCGSPGAGGQVLLNSMVMLIEFELEGNANAKKIGVSAVEKDMPGDMR